MITSRNRAVAPAVIAAIVIVVIAVGGAAAYIALSGKGSSSTITSSSSAMSTSSSSAGASSSSTGSSSSSTAKSSSSSSTSSTSTATTTFSCSTTSSGSAPPSPVPLLTAYNSQTLTFTSTSNGKTSNSTATFNVIYRSATTIKVTNTFGSGTQSETITVWMLKDGTALAVNLAGQNFTGAEANGFITGAFAGFYEEIEIGGQQSFYSGDAQYFHSTGTSSVTIGSNTLEVTNYALNSLPETVNSCGTISTYSAFTLSIGTPSGTNFPIATNLHFTGTSTVNGAPSSFDVSIQVSAFTVA